MPINSITLQPATNSLNAAYRPIVYQVIAASLPPVVFCDIYFMGVYYRSLSQTKALVTGNTTSEWRFDIQEACQEYLGKRLASNGGSAIIRADELFTTVFCRFRSSTVNVNGFTIAEGTIPMQGTGSMLPISGGGLQSNTSFALNATLQHDNSQSLATHLTAFRTGSWLNAQPLTHRPAGISIGYAHSSYFPIVYTGTAALQTLRIFYRNSSIGTYNLLSGPATVINQSNPYGVAYTVVDNGNGTQTVTYTFTNMPAGTVAVTVSYFDGTDYHNSTGAPTSPRTYTMPTGNYSYRIIFNLGNGQDIIIPISAQATIPQSVYYLPDGPKNLSVLFPAITWLYLYDYFIQIVDGAGNIVATSPAMNVSRCEPGEGVRVHFLNYLGAYDAVEFQRPRITHDDEGDTYVKGLPVAFAKPDATLNRWNVRANDTYEVFCRCRESDMNWLQELADSPTHFLEWFGIEGQPDSYLPLVKQKGSFDKVKNDGSEFQYVYSAIFVKGNPVITIRG